MDGLLSDDQTIGGRLRECRGELGLSQQEIADKLGISVRGWQKIERDEALPGGETLLRLEAAGINPGWVLTGHGPKSMHAVRSPVEGESVKADTPAIHAQIFAAVRDLVQSVHKSKGVYLRDAEQEAETIRWYNKLVAMADGSSDANKLRSRLAAIEYEIAQSAKSDAEAAKSGTGKRSA